MKKHIFKLSSLVIAVMLLAACLVGCATQPAEEPNAPAGATETASPAQPADESQAASPSQPAEAGGTIIWLSNLTSGPQYETSILLASSILDELGYKLQVVYGDMFNDPAGNLQAVKNGMVNDVVGIMMSQDGGIKAIMDEYPELYVAGYNTDMLSVFAEGGDNAAVLGNDKFLGTICDGNYDGAVLGLEYAQAVIDKGYKKVGVITFPAYAYPNLAVGAAAFRAEIDAYNLTAAADAQIEIVGTDKVLEFQPLEETWFLEDGMNELDAIAALCAGVQFVYPTMKSAMANGLCSPDTKLITGGFDTDPAIVADIGGDGIIQHIGIAPAEDIIWALIMLDNAITGNMYPDFTAPERVNARPYIIDSKEAIDNVMGKSVMGTLNFADSQLSMDDIKNVLARFNPEATYADLDALFHSEQMSVDWLKNR